MHGPVTFEMLYFDGLLIMSWVWAFTSKSVNVARGKVWEEEDGESQDLCFKLDASLVALLRLLGSHAWKISMSQ